MPRIVLMNAALDLVWENLALSTEQVLWQRDQLHYVRGYSIVD